MTRLKITVGAYQPANPDTFEEDLRKFLESEGMISEVEGKGLTVSKIAAQGRPGFIGRSVMDVLIAKPGISKRKLAGQLPDFTWKQVESALRRGYKAREITSTRKKVGRNIIWYYSATETGIKKHEETDEAEENVKQHAVSVWNTCRKLGLKEYSQLDLGLLRERAGLNGVQLRYAVNYLVEKGRIAKKWNAEEESSEYFIAKKE